MKPYPLHNNDAERRRLSLQAQAIAPLTLQMLTGAKIGKGSRVLELGCGGGDVTLLLAELTGPDGEVTAMDRDATQVEAAAARIRAAGFNNVKFIVSEMADLPPELTFDAVVGRYFLMYAQDPEAAVAQAAAWVRPGGYVGFLEMDIFRGAASTIWPPASAATEQAISFIVDVLLDAGAVPHMAARLPSMLTKYGEVQAHTSAPMQFGAHSIELPLAAVRSVMPAARQLGRSDASLHDVDALLAAELACRDDSTVTVPPMSVAAWVQL
ncbi:methyltransferase domain-containing protein [Undibacterium sp. TS12]|uniref:methyltransferase domain-containing protein n=1 Tax=Undibacterium sp. TS12 TaxID=2908202 RepID=UPI001F4C8497|nr:methyltransferase domain-containing protein [Undibacterium sp. TS12]MCH8622850.1 class I SAM-dependent methyltransferase [Undibacterium sp. TS12]